MMGTTLIFFKTDELDLGSIQRQWARVTALIPDRGEPAPPSQILGAIGFRQEYQVHFQSNPQGIDPLKDPSLYKLPLGTG